MAINNKINQTAAAYPEADLVNASSNPLSWGEYLNTNNTKLKTFAYMTFGTAKQLGKEKDNSVNGNPYETLGVVQTIDVSNSLEWIGRFEGYDMFYAWMFGWEHKTKEVEVFVTDGQDIPTIGDTYTTQGNSYDFLRYEKVTNEDFTETHYLIFENNTKLGDLTGGSGTLVGTIPSIAYTSSSVTQLYEHLYEITNDRQYRTFSSAEQTNLGAQYVDTEDFRNLCLALGKDMGDYSLMIHNAMCESFEISGAPASFLEFKTNYIPHDSSRETTTEPTYVDNCDATNPNNIINHYQTSIEVAAIGGGNYASTESNLPVTEFTIGCSIPLQKLQDTNSKQYFAEPYFENKYNLTGNIVISRHTSTQYQAWRDAQTPLRMRIASYQGFLMHEILVKNMTLDTAGAGDEDVPAESLTLDIGYKCTASEFDTWIGETQLYNSPIVFRTRDTNKYNWLTQRDLTGTKEL